MDFTTRTEALLGKGSTEKLNSKKVAVFGLGGVGGYTVEALVRAGIGNIALVDFDTVSVTNINRQLMATTHTVGQPKVDVLRERLLAINPNAEITAIQDVYCAENAESFRLGDYDYVIDAIDSLKDKAHLILEASKSGAKLFASMGAALKLDPTKVRVEEFWDVKGCPLGAALRKKFKKDKTYPKRKFKCVYSEELLENKGEAPEVDDNSTWDVKKAQINGSLVHITAIFGFTLSGLVVQDVENAIKNKDK
jgi:tRNA A37 threonylcarbamoyladenosine dehydratase